MVCNVRRLALFYVRSTKGDYLPLLSCSPRLADVVVVSDVEGEMEAENALPAQPPLNFSDKRTHSHIRAPTNDLLLAQHFYIIYRLWPYAFTFDSHWYSQRRTTYAANNKTLEKSLFNRLTKLLLLLLSEFDLHVHLQRRVCWRRLSSRSKVSTCRRLESE